MTMTKRRPIMAGRSTIAFSLLLSSSLSSLSSSSSSFASPAAAFTSKLPASRSFASARSPRSITAPCSATLKMSQPSSSSSSEAAAIDGTEEEKEEEEKEEEKKVYLPSLPLPPPLFSTVPGTWAHDTMSRRVESEILERTYEEMRDEFHSPGFESALEGMERLRSELRDASNVKIRHLRELTYDDEKEKESRAREREEWRAILEPFVSKGDTWLSAPWMVAEFYLYRRLMEEIGYFDPSNPTTHLWDPFLKAKRAGLATSAASAEGVMARVEGLPPTREGTGLAAAFALWGNKMDLSIWPADADNADRDVFSEILERAGENLLHDDANELEDHCEGLRERGGGNVDVIVDNAGFELVTDLALADHLVSAGVAGVVTFQLKSHPTFVSDAMEKDLRETVEHYASLDAEKYPYAQRAGVRWQRYLDDGKWVCREDNFWVQGSAMWDMPEPLRSDMTSRCDLAFVKGDANYRRLLGDRDWDYTAPFQDVVGAYFPCPVCALRTLKAEVGCGMDADQVERASGLDDQWMVNGRFGVVHFGTGFADA
eukprot:CAMPEP_0113586980 /NCGR_PEP_ID=MMETSP0015_2-20120614/34617_1 /TAXON_ID=2838 /ORGANISM="Odontella" /LENGTH=542 /DNA_ID=CAMNT_0000492515 /DNA_START=25 /DNA_END=1653 /DNA_ORIENTATION=+ /assembly_acc=CAM_ASM_000160